MAQKRDFWSNFVRFWTISTNMFSVNYSIVIVLFSQKRIHVLIKLWRPARAWPSSYQETRESSDVGMYEPPPFCDQFGDIFQGLAASSMPGYQPQILLTATHAPSSRTGTAEPPARQRGHPDEEDQLARKDVLPGAAVTSLCCASFACRS